MSDGAPPRLFAIVREAECQALKGLSPNASKLWIAIRYGRKETKPFACGCRDFEGWGLGRDAVARALKELVDAGLLKIIARGSFGKRGRRTEFRIVYTKAFEREQSGITDNKLVNSPDISTTSGKRVRNCRQQTAKESGFPDTPKETPPTTSSESEEGGVSAKREASTRALRESLRRIDQAAKAVAMAERCFTEKAGGREPADFLAKRFASGKLDANQLRAKLAESPAGSAGLASEGPLVFVIASGGAG